LSTKEDAVIFGGIVFLWLLSSTCQQSRGDNPGPSGAQWSSDRQAAALCPGVGTVPLLYSV